MYQIRHVVHFLVYNVLAKFQLFCIITCRDILYFVFWLPHCHTLWRHQYLVCIIQKSWISLEQDEIWQKGKHHSSSLLKAFQIRLFFNTSIFYFIGTLIKYSSEKQGWIWGKLFYKTEINNINLCHFSQPAWHSYNFPWGQKCL